MNFTRNKIKLFISYNHIDEYFKNKLENIIFKHFRTKTYEPNFEVIDDFPNYITKNNDKLTENDVFIVLVGSDTYKSKNVDCQIDYGLHKSACIMGLCLPTNNDYLKENYDPKNIPSKLAYNIYSGYASYFDWTENYEDLESYINLSFEKKQHNSALII